MTTIAERVTPIRADTYVTQLLNKVNQKTICVGVVGLGYVGLPFLVEKAKVDLNVIGFDCQAKRVEAIRRKESYINDVSNQDLIDIFKKGKVSVTTDFAYLSKADAIIICVPTPLDKNLCPDLRHVEAVSHEIAKYLRPGQLVSLESTTYPGTTSDVIQPILEATGLKSGKDFFLAHSPERVDPGNARYTTKNTNKIVGADDPDSLHIAKVFYQLAIDTVVTVTNTKTAEMVKVYENTYRAVNIALANEIALLCHRMGIDVWEMLDAAFTKPFGIMPFYPGPGVGGHCIPVDPHYLEWKAKAYHFNTRFITLAGEINRQMPLFVTNRIANILNERKKAVNGAKILILGMAYKENLPDYRESPSFEIWQLLHEAQAQLTYYDPYIPELSFVNERQCSTPLTEAMLENVDLVVIATGHRNVDYQKVLKHAPCIFDTRNVYRGIHSDKIIRL